MRQAPYSPRVWVTPLDGQSMIRHGEALRMLRRQPHPLGDIVRMTESEAVLAGYYRNNALHLLLMPSLLACAFLNNSTVLRTDLHRLSRRVYPYVAEEYFLRWREDELQDVVDELLEDLLNHGLLTATDDRREWRRPAAESSEAVQLSMLARITVPILERYYIAISLLLRAGSGRLEPEALEHQCHLTAQRMALLYELNSPEYFDPALFGNFIARLRARNVIEVGAEHRIVFDAEVLAAVAADAQYVLHEQIRNSILQVVHR
jgi:glycerol-3-phosphate O-acyltransferase